MSIVIYFNMLLGRQSTLFSDSENSCIDTENLCFSPTQKIGQESVKELLKNQTDKQNR